MKINWKSNDNNSGNFIIIGSSLNVVAANRHRRIKRKHPVINDRRKAIVSQKI